MEHYSLPAEYEDFAVPKVAKDMFLLANIINWEQYNLLEGEANKRDTQQRFRRGALEIFIRAYPTNRI